MVEQEIAQDVLVLVRRPLLPRTALFQSDLRKDLGDLGLLPAQEVFRNLFRRENLVQKTTLFLK